MSILEEHLTLRLVQQMAGREEFGGMTLQLYYLTSQLEAFWQRLPLLDVDQARGLLLDMIFQMRVE